MLEEDIDMKKADEAALERRALAAWYRTGGSERPAVTVRTHKELVYVVLESADQLLAVYRHTNQGLLRRMKRWPEAVEG